jgi:PRA1 family protein 1
MFWVLGASFFVISVHAGFYNIDAIVTEDTEGFLAETV